MKRVPILMIPLFLSWGIRANIAPPVTQMQSTSSYRVNTTIPIAAQQLQGSLATPPQSPLEENGYGPANGPRRAVGNSDSGLNPGYDPNDPGTLVPIGDALIPLLLMVMAYATFVLLRRRKSRS